jgi:hypothetical protein
MDRNYTMFGLALLTMLVVGCSSSSSPQPSSHDKALSDPMNYNPAGTEQRSISGGGILDFDKKAFGKDVDSVLSP